MTQEREFVRERFAIVKQRLEDPAADIERVARIQVEGEHPLGKSAMTTLTRWVSCMIEARQETIRKFDHETIH